MQFPFLPWQNKSLLKSESSNQDREEEGNLFNSVITAEHLNQPERELGSKKAIKNPLRN